MTTGEGIFGVFGSFVGGCIGGLALAAMSRRDAREAKAVRAEFRRLLLAEFSYWQDAADKGDDDTQIIAMGATGAIGNVLAATMGHPAAWHEKKEHAKP